MYQFVSSYLKPKNHNTSYLNVDISDMTLKHLFDNYDDGFIELTNESLSTPVYLTLDKLRRDNVPINLTLTFSRFLLFIGNLSLDTQVNKPEYIGGLVKCRDAVLAGYKVDMCEPYQDTTSEGVITVKTNLVITKDTGIAENLNGICLTTVNGLLHRNIPRGFGLEIIDGGVSWLHHKERLCSLLSFKEIGSIAQVPISEDMIHRVTPATPYARQVVINLGMDITNKSIILSLGGYMFVAPGFMRVVAEDSGTLNIDLRKLNIPELLMNSYDRIDIEALGFSKAELDRSHGCVDILKATDDIVVKKWLTLSQSFIVVVDTPILTVEYESAQMTGVYGSYEYHTNPWLPLCDHYGRLSDYWVKRQNKSWIIQLLNPGYAPRLDYTTTDNYMASINKAIPYHKQWRRVPQFIKISSMKLVS